MFDDAGHLSLYAPKLVEGKIVRDRGNTKRFKETE
jgi:hypothetical protein